MFGIATDHSLLVVATLPTLAFVILIAVCIPVIVLLILVPTTRTTTLARVFGMIATTHRVVRLILVLVIPLLFIVISIMMLIPLVVGATFVLFQVILLFRVVIAAAHPRLIASSLHLIRVAFRVILLLLISFLLISLPGC